MKTTLKGVNSVTARLADGSRKRYHYHRATGIRLDGDPGSPEFLKSYAAAEEQAARKPLGNLSAIIRGYEKSLRFRRLAESTKKEYRRVLRFWEDGFGTCPYAALEDKAFRRRVLQWHADYSAAHPREADNRVTVLSALLAWAERDGPLERNVMGSFDRAYHGDRADKIWLPEHVQAFMAVADPEMRLSMMLALHTGQRQADILALTWNNYDGTHIRLHQGKSRRPGRQGRLVTIRCTQALKMSLDVQPRRSPLMLVTKTGRAFKKRYFAAEWSATAKRAGVTDLHFHDLRGTTVTMLSEAGCSLQEVASVTGHTLKSAQQIIDKYLARTQALSDQAIERFENVATTDFAKRAAKQGGADHAK